MVPIYRRPYEDGELIIGWPTWDPTGQLYGGMSVKYRYPRSDGRTSRGAPEISVNLAVDMVLFAREHNQLTPEQVNRLEEMLR